MTIAIKAYNDQLASVKKQVEDLKKQVGSDGVRLVNLNPAVDRDATSVWGCLQLTRTASSKILGRITW